MKTLSERNIDIKKIDYVDIDETIDSVTLFFKDDSYMLCRLSSFSKQQVTKILKGIK
jgi:site-specific DNA-adenine methylase